MLNEKQLADYLKLFEKNQDAHIKFMMVEIKEMGDTINALWKAARAARKWTRAFAGSDSVDAECEMVEALDALKEN